MAVNVTINFGLSHLRVAVVANAALYVLYVMVNFVVYHEVNAVMIVMIVNCSVYRREHLVAVAMVTVSLTNVAHLFQLSRHKYHRDTPMRPVECLAMMWTRCRNRDDRHHQSSSTSDHRVQTGVGVCQRSRFHVLFESVEA